MAQQGRDCDAFTAVHGAWKALSSSSDGRAGFTPWSPQTKPALAPFGCVRDRAALWNLFSAAGRRVAVVGWWVTWPAEEVRERSSPAASRRSAGPMQRISTTARYLPQIRLRVSRRRS